MTVKVAINGYGRIGRNVLKALFESGRTSELEIVALNDLGDADSNAYLTKYDTAHGIFPFDVEVKGDALAADEASQHDGRCPDVHSMGSFGRERIVSVLRECSARRTAKRASWACSECIYFSCFNKFITSCRR